MLIKDTKEVLLLSDLMCNQLNIILNDFEELCQLLNLTFSHQKLFRAIKGVWHKIELLFEQHDYTYIDDKILKQLNQLILDVVVNSIRTEYLNDSLMKILQEDSHNYQYVEPIY